MTGVLVFSSLACRSLGYVACRLRGQGIALAAYGLWAYAALDRRITVWIQAYEVRLPSISPLGAPFSATGSNSGDSAAATAATAVGTGAAAGGRPFDLAPLEAAARWTPHVGSAVLQLSPSEQQEAAAAAATGDAACLYGDICTPRSESKAVLTFRFDGPLDSLDKVIITLQALLLCYVGYCFCCCWRRLAQQTLLRPLYRNYRETIAVGGPCVSPPEILMPML